MKNWFKRGQRALDSAPSYIAEGHPRGYNTWTQYYAMGTRLRGRVYYADIITPDAEWETYDGKKTQVYNTEAEQAPENYHHTHNHYQTFLSEVLNLTPHTNAVPIWGDGVALAHHSSAWGGFFSARSVYVDPSKNQFTHYGEAAVKHSADNPPEDEFDCQLIGAEIDVLNWGKPGVYPNKAKHGVVICGFGNPNSHAVSIICENFDCPPDMHKGQFETGIYFLNSMHPDYGRLIVADFEVGYMGLDFRRSVFKQGAVQIKTDGPGTGILFGEGRGGEIYSGSRWPDEQAASEEDLSNEWLTIRMAKQGARITSPDGARELLAIDQTGAVYIEGESLDALIQRKVAEALDRRLGANIGEPSIA